MSTRRVDTDRPRPGANQTGAGSLTTQLGAGEDPIMTEPFHVVLERVLPYDGPHSADTVEEAASGLRALVRYLNSATQGAGPGHVGNGQTTLRRAPTVDAVIGGVKSAAYLLDQLLRQLAESLERLADDETLYNDVARDDPASAARVAWSATTVLRRARERSDELAGMLEDAQSLTTHLGHDETGGGGLR